MPGAFSTAWPHPGSQSTTRTSRLSAGSWTRDGLPSAAMWPTASQAEADAIEAALDAGESFSVDAWGDWEETVPTGMVGLKFVGPGRAGATYRLMPAADYPNRRVAL